MGKKELKQAVEALKKLLVQLSLDLNLTEIGGANLQGLIRKIEGIVTSIDSEDGAKLKIANKGGSMN